MIKFRANDGDIVKLGFGLSAENVKRMQQGKPVYVDLTSMGLPGVEIMIFYGRTEEVMIRDIAKHIGPETVLHGD